jgi:hypothetical protein
MNRVTETNIRGKEVTMNVPDYVSVQIQVLREAIANKQRVEVFYPVRGKAASFPTTIDSRTILPESVGITLDNNWIVRGKRIDNGEDRCYRIAAICGLSVLGHDGAVSYSTCSFTPDNGYAV